MTWLVGFPQIDLENLPQILRVSNVSQTNSKEEVLPKQTQD